MRNQDLSRRLEQHLQLKAPPVALVFSAAPPADVPRVDRAEAAGCAYWRRAAAGEIFHTLAEDHFGCAVGAHTHGAVLGEAQQKDLQGLVETMVGLEYISMDEVPRIPRRAEPLSVVTYGPLAAVPGSPDVVLLRCSPRAAMLLAEAAQGAGVKEPAPWGMRPACAMVPEVIASKRASSSLGCIGNRVHTGLPDDELWCAVSGDAVARVVERLDTVMRANRELESFHRSRVELR